MPSELTGQRKPSEVADTRQDFNSTQVRRLPGAIIIGARKSGTRALLKFLELNPAIKSAASEVHFFDRKENYRKGLDWYRNEMPETKVNEIAIEKSPAYFVTKGVPERVMAMDCNIKLIVVFRDPVTRLISDYSQLIANQLSPDEDEGMDALREDRKASNDSTLWREAEQDFANHILRPDGRVDEQRQIVRTGMYSMYLERWLAVFPRNQFHFVDGERLIKEPHIELQKLEHFFGLKQQIKREHFVFIPRKGFYCIAQISLRRQKPSSSPVGNRSKEDHDLPICLSSTKGRRHIQVDSSVIKKLQEFYKPYNEYLNSLTGIKFDYK